MFKAKNYNGQEIQSCFQNLVWLEQGAMGAFTDILGRLRDFLMTKASSFFNESQLIDTKACNTVLGVQYPDRGWT